MLIRFFKICFNVDFPPRNIDSFEAYASLPISGKVIELRLADSVCSIDVLGTNNC